VTGQRQPSKKTFDFFFSGGTLGVQDGNLDAKKHKCLPNKTTLGFSPEGRLASKLATAGPKMHGRQLRKKSAAADREATSAFKFTTSNSHAHGRQPHATNFKLLSGKTIVL